MTCIYSHEDGAYCDKHSHGAVTLSCSGEENCPDRKVLTNDGTLQCPHYIRNIHDQGDDSLCEKWGCEVKEVAPVRHGRWIKDCKVAFFWECSECGCYVFWEPQSYLLRPEDKMNYCPNCGARLDLEEDNG